MKIFSKMGLVNFSPFKCERAEIRHYARFFLEKIVEFPRDNGYNILSSVNEGKRASNEILQTCSNR